MPTYIVKLEKDGVSKYMEWNSKTKVPLSKGMSLEEFTEYYKIKYPDRIEHLPYRMALVNKYNISSSYCSLGELMSSNLVGGKGPTLTPEEVWEACCT